MTTLPQRRCLSGLVIGVLVVLLASPAAAQDIETFVTADDGILLATDVYLSFGDGPWPVVLIRTPYDKSGLGLMGEGLAVLGFACVIQDTRGRFESEGTDTVFRDDGDDGRTTVDWIAEQEWCNGSIGTLGGSAFAITGYLLAPGAHPALASMLAVVATPDLYHHAFLQGGALRQALARNWLADQESSEMYEEIRRHRLKDDWWDPAEVLQHSDRVNAAGLHVGGWYDIFSQGTLDAFTTLQHRGGPDARGRQYLIMGPWSHNSLGSREVGEVSFPANAVLDPLDTIVPWLNHTLRGWPNEVTNWPAVLVYLMGGQEDGAPGNEWVELADWPPPTHRRRLFLAEDGGLSTSVPSAGEQEILIDPGDPVPTLGGNNLFADLVVDGRSMGDGPYDQRAIEERPDVVSYTTRPLPRPVTVMGRVSATLWIRPDTPDLDLAVRLTDVTPDGRSMLILDGIQRARMRCGDDRECLLVPGVPTEVTVDLWSTAMVFNTGHRIRIDISDSNSPRFEVNPNNGEALDDDRPGIVARPELLFGPDYPSRVELPVLVPAIRRVAPRFHPLHAHPGFSTMRALEPATTPGLLGQTFRELVQSNMNRPWWRAEPYPTDLGGRSGSR
jgi:predicted acyl esterase